MAIESKVEPTDFLYAIDDIDAAWMQSVLAAAMGDSLPTITGLRFEPIGAGTASDTQRVLIDYADIATHAPASVICKFPPKNPQSRSRVEAGETFVREASAHALVASRKACRTPAIYVAEGRRDGINLVMEDLSQRTTPGNQVSGCTVAEAGAVIDQLADLHSALPMRHDDETPAWMSSMARAANHWAPAILAAAQTAPARFGDRLSTQQYALISHCGEIAGPWLRRTPERLCLTHGDPRVDNVLFEAHPGGVGAVLLDWQMAALRDPFYDVAYFLASSLNIEDRRSAERELIGRYLDRRRDGASHAQSALADYRTAMLASATLTLLGVAGIAVTPESDRLLLTLLERSLAALEDWDSLPAISAAL